MSEAARLLMVVLVAAVVLGLDTVGRAPTYSTSEGSRWTRKGNVWSCWRTA